VQATQAVHEMAVRGAGRARHQAAVRSMRRAEYEVGVCARTVPRRGICIGKQREVYMANAARLQRERRFYGVAVSYIF